MQVDPIDGGTANTYVYVNDPVNDYDLSGMIGWKKWFKDRWSNVRSGYNKVDRAFTRTAHTTSQWADKHPLATQLILIVASTGKSGGKSGAKGGRDPLQVSIARLEVSINPAAAAKKLGYNKEIPRGDLSFTKNQPAFQKGSRYITRDIDGHKGGVWKMFDVKGNRLGTFDENLNRIGD